ncbi:MAG: hypothetical protein QM778_13520 [Myxococcales bacterium]
MSLAPKTSFCSRAEPPASTAESHGRRLRAALVGLVVWCGLASSALAEATVIVDLKTADGASAEGTVELKKGDAKFRCTTSKGHCEIKGVPGGMYSVEVSQADKPAPKPKSVMIPPSGEVKLIVNASP